MFSENKSELSIPVAGFLLLGFAALFAGMAVLNNEWGFLKDAADSIPPAVYTAAGLLLMLAAFFAFREVFLIEGTAFGIFGIFLFVLGMLGSVTPGLGFVGLMLCVPALISAFMSWRAGDLYVTLICVFAVIALAPLYFTDSAAAAAVSGIGFIAAAVIAMIYAVTDWMLVQDIASDIAEYMYGDNDDDDEHVCGCGCEEHGD